MVTTIGLSSDFNEVIKDLISLDYDAAEAYQAAIERLDHNVYKQKLAEFRADHMRHVSELTTLCAELGLEAPTGPDMKVALTKGKVVLANVFGDKAILMAMKTNEEDTNTAYERAFNHKDMKPQARDVIERAYADERRHRAWIMDTLMKPADKAA